MALEDEERLRRGTAIACTATHGTGKMYMERAVTRRSRRPCLARAASRPMLTHRERSVLVRRALPSCANHIAGKSWAGAYIRSEPLGMRERWVALEDEERLRQLIARDTEDSIE